MPAAAQTPITEVGCYLEGHRGHYLTRDAVELAIGYGFIVGPFERFALDMYDETCHSTDPTEYPHEGLQSLCEEAVEWLNSGQEDCEDCSGQGSAATILPNNGGTSKVICRACSGTGQGPRVECQNFPPRVPAGYAWGWNDGDFGLYPHDCVSERAEEIMSADGVIYETALAAALDEYERGEIE
jgi:hypothetical protein